MVHPVRRMSELELFKQESREDTSDLARRVSALEAQVQKMENALRQRLRIAEDRIQAVVYRADVVSTLPSSAPPGYLMVKPGDINLYVGTGTGSPLRKIPSQVV